MKTDHDTCTCKDKGLLKDKELLTRMLEGMMTIRKFERKIMELLGQGYLHGTAHLSVGEEATGIGTGFALSEDDYILATHRGHGQAIGKGCDVNRMMAEILGKSTGLCKGRGGSMHIADFDKGMLGANGILGANAPLACGAALTIKMKKLENRISAAFFGDGASNQGAVHESMNFAAALRLPVIFCLINNQYGMSTALSRAVLETDLTMRAAGYGIKALECDGNDVLEVYETTLEARAHAINHGPVLLLEHTYRTCGHSKSDVNRYRSKEEISYWEDRNPIKRFSSFLLRHKILDAHELAASDERTTSLINDAVTFALSCPDPDPNDVLSGVYA